MGESHCRLTHESCKPSLIHGWGTDQDGGVDTHSSKSRHASGLISSGASCWTRMEEWTPTHLSPEMPPGPTSPVQGTDQDGGVDTHSSKSRHAPGPTSSSASCQTRMEEWTPTLLSSKMPLVQPVMYRGQIRMEEWIPTLLSSKMLLHSQIRDPKDTYSLVMTTQVSSN